jgi:prevent-host-death family protein
MDVGIRELKNNLSRYLAEVSAGQEIVVTDRGRAVARITQIDSIRSIDRLIADGIVTRAASEKRPAPSRRARAKEPVSTLVADQRR